VMGSVAGRDDGRMLNTRYSIGGAYEEDDAEADQIYDK